MADAGNRLADLLGEETVEKLRQSPLWRAMRDLTTDDDVRPMPEDIEKGQEELLSYLRASVEEIMHDAKVFPQLSNIIENAARMARASFHWERNIGRTRHSAQMRRLVTLADSLAQAAALMQGVDLDEEQIISVSEEDAEIQAVEFISIPGEVKLAEIHHMLSKLQSELPDTSLATMIDPSVIRGKIEDIKHYIRGKNNG